MEAPSVCRSEMPHSWTLEVQLIEHIDGFSSFSPLASCYRTRRAPSDIRPQASAARSSERCSISIISFCALSRHAFLGFTPQPRVTSNDYEAAPSILSCTFPVTFALGRSRARVLTEIGCYVLQVRSEEEARFEISLGRCGIVCSATHRFPKGQKNSGRVLREGTSEGYIAAVIARDGRLSAAHAMHQLCSLSHSGRL